MSSLRHNITISVVFALIALIVIPWFVIGVWMLWAEMFSLLT